MLQKYVPSVLPTMYQEKNTFYKAWIMFVIVIYETMAKYIITPIVYVYSSTTLYVLGFRATAIKDGDLYKCGHTAAQHAILRQTHENKNRHVIIPVRNISMLTCDPRKHI